MIKQIMAPARCRTSSGIKICRTERNWFRSLYLILAVSAFFWSGSLMAQTSAPMAAQSSGEIGTGDTIVTDPNTGVALFGIDPLSYFLASKPQSGEARFETKFNGLMWRFSSEANKIAFLASPDPYIPAFGGYDASAIARGKLTAGDPMIFSMLNGKVYLFRSEDTREEFIKNDEPRNKAVQNWPGLQRYLVRSRP